MTERILQNYRASRYDFRVIANPADPLAHHFASWVPYYRMKAAIAQTIAPLNIMEIGVRFGYSGAAFLHGHPLAHYTGIDVDDDSFGGTKGAIQWARRILPAGQFELIVANSQNMSRLPGGFYDLIHVDGQQDGDGTFHDLEMAIKQGRYVLVDGFFWTTQNFRATSEFLRQHKELFEYYSVIPGYAGDLLIKTCSPLGEMTSSPPNTAEQKNAPESYETRYSRGADAVPIPSGTESLSDMRDLRLRNLLDLAMLHRPRRMLVLGCGRGEIAYQASAQHCEVVAADYSALAVNTARSNLADAPVEVKNRIHFVHGNPGEVKLELPVDVAVSGDLIEHLPPAELDRLYAAVARNLTPGGAFVLQTFPNKWYFEYDYRRRRRIASSVGAYLPSNPRNRFEKVMHVNEQSPKVLRRQLEKYFRHVLVWVGADDDMAGNLGMRFTYRQLAAQPNLFAVASNSPIEPSKILPLCREEGLSETEIKGIRVISNERHIETKPGTISSVAVTIENNSFFTLSSRARPPVHLSYHIRRAGNTQPVVFDGRRTILVPSSIPNSVRHYRPSFNAPDEPGDYVLQISLVQENVRWFEVADPTIACEITLAVTGR